MTAYTLDSIQADIKNGEAKTFPAGIPVEILMISVPVEDKYYTKILVTENDTSYIMLVPEWCVLEFDSPIDMAGIQ